LELPSEAAKSEKPAFSARPVVGSGYVTGQSIQNDFSFSLTRSVKYGNSEQQRRNSEYGNSRHQYLKSSKSALNSDRNLKTLKSENVHLKTLNSEPILTSETLEPETLNSESTLNLTSETLKSEPLNLTSETLKSEPLKLEKLKPGILKPEKPETAREQISVANKKIKTVSFDNTSPAIHSVQEAASSTSTSNLLLLRGDLNNIPVSILIDSGASGLGFVSERLVKRHNLKAVMPENNPFQQITLADGSVISSRGCVSTNLTIPTTSSDVSYSLAMQFLVAPLEHDVILGKAWLTMENPDIDWTKNMVNLHKPVPMTLLGEHHQNPKFLISSMQLKKAMNKHQIEQAFFVPVRFNLNELVITEENVDPKIQNIMNQLQEEYRDVFPDELPKQLPPSREFDHRIELTPEAQPFSRAPYRLSLLEQDELKKQLTELLECGFITPSKSEWGAPVLFVKKKTGELRCCVDYRRLNAVTKKNHTPIPLLDDIFERLAHAKYFSKIDLRSAYHQLLIHPDDRHKTGFSTKYGHFEFTVVPFGLTNAPASFQQLMLSIFRPYLDKFVVVYLDDILIFSGSLEEHEAHIREVLNVLRQNQLYGKWSKSEFFKSEVEYLGHIISTEGIRPNPDKLSSIREWPTPTNVRQVQQFLGLCNFYRRFISKYSSIAYVLTNLTQKNVPFIWNKEHDIAFKNLKEALISAPVLQHIDPFKPFRIESDSSNFATGSVLIQEGHPVCYHSRKFSSAEMNYPVHERELLGLLDALRKWRHLLHGNKIVAHTDHKSIIYLFSQPNLSGRQARWMIELAEFDLVINYKQGCSNIVADALSRRPDLELNLISTCNVDEHLIADIKNGYDSDPYFKPILNALLHPSEEHLTSAIPSILSWYVVDNGLLYYVREPCRRRLCIPNKSEILKHLFFENHDSLSGAHSGCKRLYLRMRDKYFWPGMTKSIQKYTSSCHSCQTNKHETQPKDGILQPLQLAHEPFQSVSMDFIVNLPKTRSGSTGIKVVVDRCTKYGRFVPTSDSCDAPKVAKLFFNEVVRNHGLPTSIVCDRDTRFMSKFWNSLFSFFGTKIKASSSFHPETDGQTEALNKTLEIMIRHYVNFRLDDWDTFLPILEFAYNSTPQASTNYSPFYLLYGRHPKDPLSLSLPRSSNNLSVDEWIDELRAARGSALDSITFSQTKQAEYANRHRESLLFSEGDLVLLSTKNIHVHVPSDKGKKLKPRFIGPFKIINKLSDVTYKLELPPGLSKLHPVFHVNLLRKYISPDPDLQETLPRPPPVFVDESAQQYFEVEQILDHRTHRRHKQYLIKWLGYPLHDATWESAKNIRDDVPELVNLYEESLNKN
jgi:hypothetical protein